MKSTKKKKIYITTIGRYVPGFFCYYGEKFQRQIMKGVSQLVERELNGITSVDVLVITTLHHAHSKSHHYLQTLFTKNLTFKTLSSATKSFGDKNFR